MKKNTYYFIIGSHDFLLKEEPLEEVLRERAQYYNRNNKELDFWILLNPPFLSSKPFEKVKNMVPDNCVAILSTNKLFITWLKLRLNNVLSGEFNAPTKSINSPLKI